LVSITEFARRVRVTPHTIFTWLRKRRMPAGSVVVDVNGRRYIDWTVWEDHIRPVI